MKHIVQIVLLLMFVSARAQNLIPNPGFENKIGCPSSIGRIDSLLDWKSASIGSPDYYNVCNLGNAGIPSNNFGYQFPNSGSAYAGLYLWTTIIQGYREYIFTRLTSPLIADHCYHFEMFVSLADNSSYTSSNISVYISSVVPHLRSNTHLRYTPQINNSPGTLFNYSNWTRVSGDYLATGGEEFICIGNFNNDLTTNLIFLGNFWLARMSYSYIDDVSLVEVPNNSGVCTSPLPVELISFDAEEENDVVKLKWITASETNNDYFILQKSIDGIFFDKFGTVNGAGNSSVENTYSLIDNALYFPITYYRLLQTDYDGKTVVAGNTLFSLQSKDEINIHWNDETHSLSTFIKGNKNLQYSLYVFNSSGKLIHQNKINESGVIIMSGLSPGVYVTHVSGMNQNFLKKFIVF